MRKSFFLVILFSCCFQYSGCKKITLPQVSTVSVFPAERWEETYYGKIAYLGEGMITSDGGSNRIVAGICYSELSDTPTKDNPYSFADPAKKPFYCRLNLKNRETKYYVRAFAENEAGISYGETITFTTLCFDNFDLNFDYKFALILNFPVNTVVPTKVTLSWHSVYGSVCEIYLDKNNPPTTLIASGLTASTYEISGLSSSTTYYWKVVQKLNDLSCPLSSTVAKFTTIQGE